MNKIHKKSLIILITIILIDQVIKYLFVSGYNNNGKCISFILTFNKGVAFSIGAFLDEWLKYIQLVMVSGVLIYVFYLKEVCYAFPAGLLLGGAFSNVYDRFIHGGVVDYVYWHCGFDFAIFNLADVLIDIAVVLILYINYKNGAELNKGVK